MWFTGNNGADRIIYCESSNGINWINYQLALDLGAHGIYDSSHLGRPSVIWDNSIYRMMYYGSDGADLRILYCESKNCINWFNNQLVVDKGKISPFDNFAFAPSFINEFGKGKMWYNGEDGGGAYRVIYCETC